MDFKVLSGVVLGAMLSGISYLIKSKQENKKYFNEVLFNLLEIWKLINISYIFTSNIFPKTLVARIKNRFPKEQITEKDEKIFQKFIPQAMEMVDKESGFPEINLYDRYINSIQKLSSVHPILAHSLSGNYATIKYLKGMDNYIKTYTENPENEYLDEYSDTSIANTKLFIESGALKELEKDLKSLSLKSSIFNWYKVSSKIKRSRDRRKSIPLGAIDQYIDLVIEPLIRKRYQDSKIPYPY